MTADQVVAIATTGQALGVLAALFFAWRQVHEVVDSRREQSRPYVVVSFDFPEDRSWLPELCVANLGATAAYDVRCSFDPPLRSSVYTGKPDAGDLRLFEKGLPTLVPHQRASTLFDSLIDRPKEWEDAYNVTVTYRDRFGSLQRDNFSIDLGPHKLGLHAEYKGLKAIYAELEKIRRLLEKLGTSAKPFHIVAESATERRRHPGDSADS